MATRMDQAREDAAFRRTKTERVKDKISTGAVRKLDKDGLSKETKNAFRAYGETFRKQQPSKAKPAKGMASGGMVKKPMTAAKKGKK
jgi:hypothetical protein